MLFLQQVNALLKIFKRNIGDNVNPCPIDKPYISLVNKVETQFLLISLQRESKYLVKKVFDKTIDAQVHGSNLVIFDFLENDIFFCNTEESSELLNRLT